MQDDARFVAGPRAVAFANEAHVVYQVRCAAERGFSPLEHDETHVPFVIIPFISRQAIGLERRRRD